MPAYECDPRGTKAQPAKCAAAAVEAYPTWVVNGKTLTGVQTLAALEAALGETTAARAADSILISPENVKRRRTAPAEEPCDDCAVDAKPSVT